MQSASRWNRVLEWLRRLQTSQAIEVVVVVLGASAVALALIFSGYAMHLKSEGTELHLHPVTSSTPAAHSAVSVTPQPKSAAER